MCMESFIWTWKALVHQLCRYTVPVPQSSPTFPTLEAGRGVGRRDGSAWGAGKCMLMQLHLCKGWAHAPAACATGAHACMLARCSHKWGCACVPNHSFHCPVLNCSQPSSGPQPRGGVGDPAVHNASYLFSACCFCLYLTCPCHYVLVCFWSITSWILSCVWTTSSIDLVVSAYAAHRHPTTHTDTHPFLAFSHKCRIHFFQIYWMLWQKLIDKVDWKWVTESKSTSWLLYLRQ